MTPRENRYHRKNWFNKKHRSSFSISRRPVSKEIMKGLNGNGKIDLAPYEAALNHKRFFDTCYASWIKRERKKALLKVFFD